MTTSKHVQDGLLSFGIQADKMLYGYVQACYGDIVDGTATIRALLPYRTDKNKKWKNFRATASDVGWPNIYANSEFLLRLCNFVEFLPNIDEQNRLVATKIRIMSAKTTEPEIEAFVENLLWRGQYNIWAPVHIHKSLPKLVRPSKKVMAS